MEVSLHLRPYSKLVYLDYPYLYELKRLNDHSHGGNLLYVKSRYRYLRHHDLEIQGIRSVWIKTISTTKHFLYGAYYRQPNTSTV
jgi:hypothetical protein